MKVTCGVSGGSGADYSVFIGVFQVLQAAAICALTANKKGTGTSSLVFFKSNKNEEKGGIHVLGLQGTRLLD